MSFQDVEEKAFQELFLHLSHRTCEKYGLIASGKELPKLQKGHILEIVRSDLQDLEPSLVKPTIRTHQRLRLELLIRISHKFNPTDARITAETLFLQRPEGTNENSQGQRPWKTPA